MITVESPVGVGGRTYAKKEDLTIELSRMLAELLPMLKGYTLVSKKKH
jgi:hypothetical protein